MIRMDALRQMLLIETAAANWYAKMNPREQQAYNKAHPRSKYAKNSGGILAKQAEKLGHKHDMVFNRHEQKFHDINGGRPTPKNPRGKYHDAMSGHHGNASKSYNDAADHFTAGRTKEGHAALKAGHRHAQKGADLRNKYVGGLREAKAARRDAGASSGAGESLRPARKRPAGTTKAENVPAPPPPKSKGAAGADRLERHMDVRNADVRAAKKSVADKRASGGTDHVKVLNDHEWEKHSGDRDHNHYHMNDLRDHTITHNVKTGEWHHDDEDNTVAKGKGSESLHKHLSKVHNFDPRTGKAPKA